MLPLLVHTVKQITTGLLSHVLSGMEPTSYLIGDGTGKGVENSEYFVLKLVNINVTLWRTVQTMRL